MRCMAEIITKQKAVSGETVTLINRSLPVPGFCALNLLKLMVLDYTIAKLPISRISSISGDVIWHGRLLNVGHSKRMN
ncbi:hypothetical protein quinque_005485 [Culex quinquefasciatus]